MVFLPVTRAEVKLLNLFIAVMLPPLKLFKDIVFIPAKNSSIDASGLKY